MLPGGPQGEGFVPGQKTPFHRGGMKASFSILPTAIIPVTEPFYGCKGVVFAAENATGIDLFEINRFIRLIIKQQVGRQLYIGNVHIIRFLLVQPFTDSHIDGSLVTIQHPTQCPLRREAGVG